MTRGEFQAWVARAIAIPGSTVFFDMANEIRPYDSEAADLFMRQHEAEQAIFRHLLRKAEKA